MAGNAACDSGACFGKVRDGELVVHGKGSRRKRAKPRLVQLINAPQSALIYRDMHDQFDDGHERPGVPL